MSTKPSFDCIENQQGSQGGAWLGESKYWKMNKLNKPENSRFGEREREPNLWSGATRAEKSLLIGNSALRPRYLMNTECTSYYHHTLKLISFLCFFNLLSLSFRSCSYIELSTDSLQVMFLRCVHRVGNIFQCKLSRFKGAVEVIKKPQVVWPPAVLIHKESTDVSLQSSEENFAKCGTDVNSLSSLWAPTMRKTFPCREAYFAAKFTARSRYSLPVYENSL